MSEGVCEYGFFFSLVAYVRMTKQTEHLYLWLPGRDRYEVGSEWVWLLLTGYSSRRNKIPYLIRIGITVGWIVCV